MPTVQPDVLRGRLHPPHDDATDADALRSLVRPESRALLVQLLEADAVASERAGELGRATHRRALAAELR